MKRVLSYDSHATNLIPFFLNKDHSNNARGKYDIILCDRDQVQERFDHIKKYVHKDTKVIVNVCSESGCYEDWLLSFTSIVEKNLDIKFLYISDVNYQHNLPKNVTVLSSPILSFNMYFESYNLNNDHIYIFDQNIYHKVNGFCCLNGRLRGHRIHTLLEFVNRNLLDRSDSYVSFLFYSNKNKFDKDEYIQYINNSYDLNDDERSILKNVNLPIHIENDTIGDYLPTVEISQIPFDKIINLVSENVTGMECDETADVITFTEKSWVPFKAHQLPIYIANKGHVDEIRKLGFDLFDDIIDHSYDTVEDPIQRLKLSIDQLELLLEKDVMSFYEKNYKRFLENSLLVEQLKISGTNMIHNFMVENEAL